MATEMETAIEGLLDRIEFPEQAEALTKMAAALCSLWNAAYSHGYREGTEAALKQIEEATH